MVGRMEKQNKKERSTKRDNVTSLIKILWLNGRTLYIYNQKGLFTIFK